MTKYVCTVCGKPQYSADPYSTAPCIYCEGEVKKEEAKE